MSVNLKCLTPDCLYLRHTDIEVFKGYCCRKCMRCQKHGINCVKVMYNTPTTQLVKLKPVSTLTDQRAISKMIRSNSIFFHQNKYVTYSPLYGLNIYKKNSHTEFIRDNAIVFFKLLETLNINYGLFAGNSIGYVRNKANMPWVDDYDIMVFGKDIDKSNDLNNNLLFRKNGFIAKKSWFGLFIYNDIVCDANAPHFQCDIFFSKITNENIVVNCFGKGLYNKKKMPKDVVLPFKKLNIDGIDIFGLNDPVTEVQLCYGDISKGVLYSHNAKVNIKTEHWSSIYNFFKNKIERGKRNVLNKLNIKMGDKKITIIKKKKYVDFVDALIDVASKAGNVLNVFDQEFIQKYIYDIKFYLPDITVKYYHTTTDIIPPIFLNKCDYVYFKYSAMLKHYDSESIFYIKKPVMDTIKLITFGTFDLFHIGHKNIFDKCKNYAETIVVGLSSDRFTHEKKNIYPTDNFETRKNNIMSYSKFVVEVFSEEKMELKNEYIKKHNANLLLMGDDWAGHFDSMDCAVIYEKRTPDISSTMLRNNLIAASA
jgi:glycerol-3-phosphate cytidylyltransferase